MTDKQWKALQNRLFKLGKAKLIDRLENEQINANSAGNKTAAARAEWSLKWARKQPDWSD
jgi:hypothetical protein